MSDPESDQRGHEFTFNVELRGEGCNWSTQMEPQTILAYSLPEAIRKLQEIPFQEWFKEESDEVITPPKRPGFWDVLFRNTPAFTRIRKL